MSQESTAPILDVETRSEETRSFIRQVRRVTRRKFTPEEKIRIVLEGLRHEVSIRCMSSAKVGQLGPEIIGHFRAQSSVS